MRGYDQWVTREPPWMDYEPPVYKCARCGKFLKHEPEGTREWVVLRRCDGESKVIECRYDDGTHEGILAIIGEEYRDKTYKLAYPPACGSKDGSHDMDFDGEISVEQAEEYRHAPHFYVEPFGWQMTELRTCARCGFLNEEPLV